MKKSIQNTLSAIALSGALLSGCASNESYLMDQVIGQYNKDLRQAELRYEEKRKSETNTSYIRFGSIVYYTTRRLPVMLRDEIRRKVRRRQKAKHTNA